jgi:hypothetical protein
MNIIMSNNENNYSNGNTVNQENSRSGQNMKGDKPNKRGDKFNKNGDKFNKRDDKPNKRGDKHNKKGNKFNKIQKTRMTPKEKMKVINNFKTDFASLYNTHLKSKIEKSLKQFKSMSKEEKGSIKTKVKTLKNIHQKVIQAVNILDETLKNKRMISNSANKKKFNNFIFKNLIGSDIKLNFENPGIVFFKTGNDKEDYKNAFDIGQNIIGKIISEDNTSVNNDNNNNSNNNVNDRLLNNKSVSNNSILNRDSNSNNSQSNIDYFNSFELDAETGNNKETMWIFIIVIMSSILSKRTDLGMFKNKSELDKLYSIPCIGNCEMFKENKQSRGGFKKGRKDEKGKKGKKGEKGEKGKKDEKGKKGKKGEKDKKKEKEDKNDKYKLHEVLKNMRKFKYFENINDKLQKDLLKDGLDELIKNITEKNPIDNLEIMKTYKSKRNQCITDAQLKNKLENKYTSSPSTHTSTEGGAVNKKESKKIPDEISINSYLNTKIKHSYLNNELKLKSIKEIIKNSNYKNTHNILEFLNEYYNNFTITSLHNYKEIETPVYEKIGIKILEFFLGFYATLDLMYSQVIDIILSKNNNDTNNNNNNNNNINNNSVSVINNNSANVNNKKSKSPNISKKRKSPSISKKSKSPSISKSPSKKNNIINNDNLYLQKLNKILSVLPPTNNRYKRIKNMRNKFIRKK